MQTLIKNGLVITPAGRSRASIGVRDGVIAGVYEPGSEPPAAETIDAKGLAVLPGVVIAGAVALLVPSPARLRSIGWTLVGISLLTALIIVIGERS